MPRAFISAGNFMYTALGALTGFTYGSYVSICRKTVSGGDGALVVLRTSGGTDRSYVFVNADTSIDAQFGSYISSPSMKLLAADGWVLLAATKGSGTVPVDFHKYSYATNTWTTETGPSSANCTAPGVGGRTEQGNYNNSSNFPGYLAAQAVFADRKLTATELADLPFSLASWLSLNPSAMWVFDQSATTQTVLDWTGGGANQTTLFGTTVAPDSVPVLGYGHPVILSTRTTPNVAAAALTLPSLSAAGTLAVGTPHVTGTPQAFAFNTSGTVLTYTGGGSTGTSTWDALAVNSDNVVTTPAGWTQVASRINSQGAYLFARNGGTSTATIDLGGGVASNTSALWVRIHNADSIDTAVTATEAVDGGSGTTTPAITTGALSAADSLVLAFAALHNNSGGTPATGWSGSSGYTVRAFGTQGTAGSAAGVAGAVATKIPAGPGTEAPTISWANAYNDRYILATAFLPVPSSAGATGTAAIGLPALTAAGSGTVSATGSAALTLPALSAAAAGTVTAAGTAVLLLPALTAAASGTVGAAGSAALALPALSAAASATASTAGSAAVTLPALTSAGAGVAAASGSAALTLPSLTTSSTGTVTATGVAAATLPPVTAAAVGTASASGTGSAGLPALAAAAAGIVTASGTAALTLPALGASATGGAGNTGIAALTLPTLIAAGSGTASAAGTSAVTLPALQAAAVGNVAGAVSGGAAVTLPSLTAAGSGTASTAGTALVALPALAASGSGAASNSGTSALVLPPLTAAGSGSSGVAATGNLALPALTAAGTATAVVTGIAAVALPALVAAANGTSPVDGTAVLVLPALTASGTDQPIYTRRPGVVTIGATRATLTVGTTRGPTITAGG